LFFFEKEKERILKKEKRKGEKKNEFLREETVINIRKERWLSGLKRLIANPLYIFFCTEGSNPSLSARIDKKPEGHFSTNASARIPIRAF